MWNVIKTNTLREKFIFLNIVLFLLNASYVNYNYFLSEELIRVSAINLFLLSRIISFVKIFLNFEYSRICRYFLMEFLHHRYLELLFYILIHKNLSFAYTNNQLFYNF